MERWVEDSVMKRSGGGRRSKVDWTKLFVGARIDFEHHENQDEWSYLVTTSDRNNASYVRKNFPEWEISTRASLMGFDWYARPKKETK